MSDGIVAYDDGTPATVPQMARDVTAFLAWAADPHMAERKVLGMKVVVFLILLTIMFIALKLEVWAHLHRAPDAEGKGSSRSSTPLSSPRAR